MARTPENYDQENYGCLRCQVEPIPLTLTATALTGVARGLIILLVRGWGDRHPRSDNLFHVQTLRRGLFGCPKRQPNGKGVSVVLRGMPERAP